MNSKTLILSMLVCIPSIMLGMQSTHRLPKLDLENALHREILAERRVSPTAKAMKLELEWHNALQDPMVLTKVIEEQERRLTCLRGGRRIAPAGLIRDAGVTDLTALYNNTRRQRVQPSSSSSSSSYNGAPQTPQLIKAIRDENIDEVEEILTTTDALPDTIDHRGNTPIHVAARASNLGILLMLLEKKGADTTTPDHQRKTPLHIAAEKGWKSGLQELLHHARTITPALLDSVDDKGYTPLHYAAQRGDIDSMRLLLEHGANPNIQDDAQKTALHHVVELRNLTRDRAISLAHKQKNLDAVRLLLAYGADASLQDQDYITTPDPQADRTGGVLLSGKTAYHYATQQALFFRDLMMKPAAYEAALASQRQTPAQLEYHEQQVFTNPHNPHLQEILQEEREKTHQALKLQKLFQQAYEHQTSLCDLLLSSTGNNNIHPIAERSPFHSPITLKTGEHDDMFFGPMEE